MRRGDGTSSKDFKTTRTREQVLASLNSFLQGYPHAAVSTFSDYIDYFLGLTEVQ